MAAEMLVRKLAPIDFVFSLPGKRVVFGCSVFSYETGVSGMRILMMVAAVMLVRKLTPIDFAFSLPEGRVIFGGSVFSYKTRVIGDGKEMVVVTLDRSSEAGDDEQ